MGFVFIPTGFITLRASRDAIEIIDRYDVDCIPEEYKANKLSYITNSSIPKNCTRYLKEIFRVSSLLHIGGLSLNEQHFPSIEAGVAKVAREGQRFERIEVTKDQALEMSLSDLEQALEDFGKPFLLNEGDGPFYGPKIDISVSDAMKRKIQCATLQEEDEVKRKRPVMIHRAVLGSVERMFAILLEHYKGKWPFWFSPRQAIVCSVSNNHNDYAEEILHS
ncbi:unnamed protein product [Arabis nemorensis]|uniref:Threonyl-tRNA synthetase n=1 Tax=Arabis nemorensis TaxID=586526 RepID=A0A565C0S1_9BRAS|nr:unnamed protein product [Arabis nemorensis]